MKKVIEVHHFESLDHFKKMHQEVKKIIIPSLIFGGMMKKSDWRSKPVFSGHSRAEFYDDVYNIAHVENEENKDGILLNVFDDDDIAHEVIRPLWSGDIESLNGYVFLPVPKRAVEFDDVFSSDQEKAVLDFLRKYGRRYTVNLFSQAGNGEEYEYLENFENLFPQYYSGNRFCSVLPSRISMMSFFPADYSLVRHKLGDVVRVRQGAFNGDVEIFPQ